VSPVDVQVRRLMSVSEDQVHELAQVLLDCVEGGASVGFMQPLTLHKALTFWQRVADGVVRGDRALLVAEQASRIVGTVQLVMDLPENQPHRADVSKMLVHRSARGRGVGALLRQAVERVARDCGRIVLVLDTANDVAARLYARSGWIECGTVPDYALLPQGGYCATTFFYRRL